MKFLTQAFSGREGKPSSIRLMSAFVVVGVLFTYIYLCVVKKEPVQLGPEPWGALVGSLLAKGWQRGKETSQNLQSQV